jgi:hypothetical protein
MVREGPAPERLAPLLAAVELDREAAGCGLLEMLESPLAFTVEAGACALGVLQYAPAGPALLALLDEAEPPVYVAAARALAQLGVARAVPVYAALALAPPRPFRFEMLPVPPPLPELPGFPLAPLLAASFWLHRAGSGRRERALATAGFHAPGVMNWWSDPSPDERAAFAESLARSGEHRLLKAVAALAQGNAAACFADARLFEALVIALLQRAWWRRPDPAGAALAGLEAIGERRCLALLSWLAGPGALAWTEARMREQCRAAAARLHERRPRNGREAVPSPPPEGSGTEAVAVRQPAGVEGEAP